MSDDLAWRDDIAVLKEAADVVCLPCRQSMPLINQRMHAVAENGVNTFCSADNINRLMEQRMLRFDRSDSEAKYSDLLQSHYSLCVKIEELKEKGRDLCENYGSLLLVLHDVKRMLLERGYNPLSAPIYLINDAVGIKNTPYCKCPNQTGVVSVNGCCVGCKLPIEHPFQRCTRDTDGDGNCWVHPSGCPQS